MQYKCKRLTAIVFGTVHSARTVVVFLHKHFSSWLSTFCNSSGIIMNCMCIAMSKSNITAYVNSSFTFFMLAYYVCFSSILVVFHQFSSWITLDDVDVCFSIILVTKATAVEGGTTSAAWLYHQCTLSIHVADGMIVMSLSASLQHDNCCRGSCIPNHGQPKIILRIWKVA
jgi:hypothetical protein